MSERDRDQGPNQGHDQGRDQGQEAEKLKPSHRVSFARVNGRDRDGNDILGRSQEVGQVWPRRGKEGEGILRFDHIPEEMRSRNGGVLFISSLDKPKEAEGQQREAPKGRGRDGGHER